MSARVIPIASHRAWRRRDACAPDPDRDREIATRMASAARAARVDSARAIRVAIAIDRDVLRRADDIHVDTSISAVVDAAIARLRAEARR